MRNCIFCQKNKVSREHVLSAWIFKNKNNCGSIEPTAYITPHDGPIVVQRFEEKFIERSKIKNDNFVCRCVCEHCNNGWMSELEQQAKAFVESSSWGTKEPCFISSDSSVLLRWMMVKFLVFCQSMGIGKVINKSMARDIYLAKRPKNIHFDYYLGEHYSVDFSLTQGMPDPNIDEAARQRILNHTGVFSAQLGKLYVRVVMAESPITHQLVLMRFNTNTILSDYSVAFHKGVTDPATYVGTKAEFVLFANSIMVTPIA